MKLKLHQFLKLMLLPLPKHNKLTPLQRFLGLYLSCEPKTRQKEMFETPMPMFGRLGLGTLSCPLSWSFSYALEAAGTYQFKYKPPDPEAKADPETDLSLYQTALLYILLGDDSYETETNA